MAEYWTHPEHGAMWLDTADAKKTARDNGWQRTQAPTADEVRAAKAKYTAERRAKEAQEAAALAREAAERAESIARAANEEAKAAEAKIAAEAKSGTLTVNRKG